MKPRQKRTLFVIAGLATAAAATALLLNAFSGNLVYSLSPTEIAEGKAPTDRSFRLLGMVEKGSLERQPDGLTVHFMVTDFAHTTKVRYTGILPDLFSEGQGAVAQGRLGPDGIFTATEVLAKHDETYMPPEVAEALEAGKKADLGKTVVN